MVSSTASPWAARCGGSAGAFGSVVERSPATKPRRLRNQWRTVLPCILPCMLLILFCSGGLMCTLSFWSSSERMTGTAGGQFLRLAFGPWESVDLWPATRGLALPGCVCELLATASYSKERVLGVLVAATTYRPHKPIRA